MADAILYTEKWVGGKQVESVARGETVEYNVVVDIDETRPLITPSWSIFLERHLPSGLKTMSSPLFSRQTYSGTWAFPFTWTEEASIPYEIRMAVFDDGKQLSETFTETFPVREVVAPPPEEVDVYEYGPIYFWRYEDIFAPPAHRGHNIIWEYGKLTDAWLTTDISLAPTVGLDKIVFNTYTVWDKAVSGIPASEAAHTTFKIPATSVINGINHIYLHYSPYIPPLGAGNVSVSLKYLIAVAKGQKPPPAPSPEPEPEVKPEEELWDWLKKNAPLLVGGVVALVLLPPIITALRPAPAPPPPYYYR